MSKQLFHNVDIPNIPTIAERIKYYIDLRYAEKFQIQELANDLGIHPNYLSQVFHNSYGISPKQYLMEQKMSKAAHLLTSTETSISSISASLGFEDQLAFSKSFKKHYRCSPSAYRKENKADA